MNNTTRVCAALALAAAALSFSGAAHADDDVLSAREETGASTRSTLGNEEWLLVGNSLWTADGNVEFK
ncbi:hypothetical protein ACE1OC_00315 [Streptomyces sp. DSM 116496]|uniref:hypothetical protein n=1 Tax=Streptomyces stoeckheimensis TaxID=3344656 RepID=UPI0038B414A3